MAINTNRPLCVLKKKKKKPTFKRWLVLSVIQFIFWLCLSVHETVEPWGEVEVQGERFSNMQEALGLTSKTIFKKAVKFKKKNKSLLYSKPT